MGVAMTTDWKLRGRASAGRERQSPLHLRKPSWVTGGAECECQANSPRAAAERGIPGEPVAVGGVCRVRASHWF